MRRFVVTLSVAALLAGGSLHAAEGAASPIATAPAFSIPQLRTLPSTAWITNGGSLANQRYSPLKRLTPQNVAGLKAKWRTGLGSGTSPGESGQAQILAYEGTLYVSNGANDVFALDVDSGAIRWTYRGKPDPKSGAPFGRSNRGVALGDGRVYVAQLDARLVALDQRSGNVLWNVEVEPWQKGYSITAAPLYYEGMVITGVSGGVMGRRCSLTAYDAKTGKLLWRFHTIPGPGEIGHDTWPQEGDAWQHGGAPVWQTPAVDPELGLLYFSTGNAGPVMNGSVRGGDNLFTDSIVALEVRTGRYRWHFQQVHHDIWDYDSPNPVVLFDAVVHERLRKGLVQVSKTGWAYILDRTDGKPLIGIEERPVPQEPRQLTSATQPYPIGDPIVPHEVDIVPEGITLPPGQYELPNKGRIFTPFWKEKVVLRPAPQGGANWPPSSFDPESNLLYVCATDRIATMVVQDPLEPPRDNVPYFGGTLGQADAADRGIFAALDVRTNRLVWRQQWRDTCYSGSVVTAGGLVFVGRADGRLTAIDKRNGAPLWSFMTDAGVNSTVTTFEHKGQQLVVVHAGGGVFANGRRGDGIWMFGLDGTIGPVTPAAAPRAGQPPVESVPMTFTRPADRSNGESIYRQTCLPCHGPTGRGGEGGGKTLVEGLTSDVLLSVTAAGRNNMPAFRGTYSADELRDVAAYILEVLARQ
jgi:alcohol dehydrogenase (cytochrome c)